MSPVLDDGTRVRPDSAVYNDTVMMVDFTSFTQVHSFLFHTDPLLSFFDQMDYGSAGLHSPTVPPDDNV